MEWHLEKYFKGYLKNKQKTLFILRKECIVVKQIYKMIVMQHLIEAERQKLEAQLVCLLPRITLFIVNKMQI